MASSTTATGDQETGADCEVGKFADLLSVRASAFR